VTWNRNSAATPHFTAASASDAANICHTGCRPLRARPYRLA
jgi:hypothetical protein